MSKALLRDWMERLGLQEWRIKLEDCCDPRDMQSQDCFGCTEWSEATKTARIQIIDPDCTGGFVVPFDYEKTLVHELLHLKTCLISDSDDKLQERIAHQLIDDLARTLVQVRREALEIN